MTEKELRIKILEVEEDLEIAQANRDVLATELHILKQLLKDIEEGYIYEKIKI